jgi:anti-sigma regulatory factor (Ser/Thr protein kinase)
MRMAREFARRLVDRHDDNFGETVVLLVSELVSNAVEHGGPHGPDATVGVSFDDAPGGVRVEVTDAGSGLPRVGDGAVDRPSGRGLFLVDALASSWGCDRLGVGKKVWFELLSSNGGAADG